MYDLDQCTCKCITSHSILSLQHDYFNTFANTHTKILEVVAGTHQVHILKSFSKSVHLPSLSESKAVYESFNLLWNRSRIVLCPCTRSRPPIESPSSSIHEAVELHSSMHNPRARGMLVSTRLTRTFSKWTCGAVLLAIVYTESVSCT